MRYLRSSLMLMGLHSRLGHRKIDLEDGPFAKTAPDGNPAFVVVDNASDNPQSQAGTLFPFRGHERLKDVADNLGSNSGPGIGDQDPDPNAHTVNGSHRACADAQTTAGGHGVAGVEHQIG